MCKRVVESSRLLDVSLIANLIEFTVCVLNLADEVNRKAYTKHNEHKRK